MKYIIFIFLSLVTSFTSAAQISLLFERFNFDTTYKIVGLSSQLDKRNVYQKLTFIISNLDNLKTAKQNVTQGKALTDQSVSDDDMEVHIVKNKEVIETYFVNPTSNYISYHSTDSTHGIFSFDISQLLQLADVKPVNYRSKEYTFKSEDDFIKFLGVNMPKKSFVCWEDLSDEQGGHFSLIIPKSDKIQKFKDGWAEIEAELNSITTNKKEFLLSFNLTKSTDTTFYYQVNASKSIYDKFILKDYRKSSWIANEIEISTIWLK